MTLPPEGVFHNLVFVSIRKQYPYQAFKVMHGLWGMGQMMFSKYIVAVDEEFDAYNKSAVVFPFCADNHPGRGPNPIKKTRHPPDPTPTHHHDSTAIGLGCNRTRPR